MTCQCPSSWTGATCTVPSGCGAGLGYSDTGTCSECQAGTFSFSGFSCSPCQVGTYSSISATYCLPCDLGQYSSTLGSTTCNPCNPNKCSTIGSITSSPISPAQSPFNFTVLNQDGTLVAAASPFIVGWVYFGLFGGFVVLSSVFAPLLRKQLRRPILAAAVILRTPATILKVIVASESLVEVPSFFRGLVGLWVFGGVCFITAYQIDIFITQAQTQLTAVQPGTVFTNGSSTSSVTASISLSIVLFQTPITCDPTAFTLTFSALDSKSSGSLTGHPTFCAVDLSVPSVTLNYTFPAPISFTSTSSVIFVASSVNGSPLFSHGVSYQLALSSYQERSVKMWETLTNEASNQLTGNVTVDLSAIPTEVLSDTITQSLGYTYTYFSSSADSLNVTTSSTLSATFNFQEPQYFYQIKSAGHLKCRLLHRFAKSQWRRDCRRIPLCKRRVIPPTSLG